MLATTGLSGHKERLLRCADTTAFFSPDAFRHGLATESAESEPITVLQAQMRHADVRTTLKVYAHVVPQSQRNSMERIANRSIGTNVANGTGSIA